MRGLLASTPPTADRIAESTAKVLKENESQAVIVLLVIALVVLLILVVALASRGKKSRR